MPRKWPQKNSADSKNDTKPSDDEQEDPPQPQDEEVLLIEEVVLEDAEVVGLVHPARGGAHLDVAADLRWKEFAHWVVQVLSPPRVLPVHREIVEDLGSVPPELVVQYPVGHLGWTVIYQLIRR